MKPYIVAHGLAQHAKLSCYFRT